MRVFEKYLEKYLRPILKERSTYWFIESQYKIV
jgi:hypothetical protein